MEDGRGYTARLERGSQRRRAGGDGHRRGVGRQTNPVVLCLRPRHGRLWAWGQRRARRAPQARLRGVLCILVLRLCVAGTRACLFFFFFAWRICFDYYRCLACGAHAVRLDFVSTVVYRTRVYVQAFMSVALLDCSMHTLGVASDSPPG